MTMKTVYIAISADILHHGHINLIKRASEYGELITRLLNLVQSQFPDSEEYVDKVLKESASQ